MWQIIDVAANIIRDDIRMRVYNLTEYSIMEETYDGLSVVPKIVRKIPSCSA